MVRRYVKVRFSTGYAQSFFGGPSSLLAAQRPVARTWWRWVFTITCHQPTSLMGGEFQRPSSRFLGFQYLCRKLTDSEVLTRLPCASVLPPSRNCLSAEEGGQASPPDLGGPGRRGNDGEWWSGPLLISFPTMKKRRMGGDGALDCAEVINWRKAKRQRLIAERLAIHVDPGCSPGLSRLQSREAMEIARSGS